MVSWKKLFEYIEAVSCARGLEDFCRCSLQSFGRLTAFDGAFVWICEQPFHPVVRPDNAIIHNFPAEYHDKYQSYYYTVDPLQRLASPADVVRITNWNDFSDTEFVTDLMHPMSVHHSLGYFLHDPGLTRFAVTAFFRSGRRGFEQPELQATRMVLPALRGLFARALDEEQAGRLLPAERRPGSRPLSRREHEIARLLCTRLRVPEIAARLAISPRTAEKHIEHIYDKLDLSNRRELQEIFSRPETAAPNAPNG